MLKKFIKYVSLYIALVFVFSLCAICFDYQDTVVYEFGKTVTKEYEATSELTEMFADDIQYFKDTYGFEITLISDISEHDYYSEYVESKNITAGTTLNEYAVKKTLEMLKSELATYSDEAIEKLPTDWHILPTLVMDDNSYIGGIFSSYQDEEGNTQPWGITLSESMFWFENPKSVIHHEIFHGLSYDWTQEDYDNFYAVEGTCDMISDYACTSPVEEIAETWAYSKDDNLRANYLRDTYSYYVK